ncbi:tRNA lysidine(34) synthetase TilS [Mycolicibacterium komossense]|uniref:tRNA(Ile)-lysidine synthase n=1 Tax=Mycolicibacterium komossense TaxID=1779 RepID=A0ABT3CM26_9MYCO|nr:tRNA lysidine(34) synthetase TilS [Mycolicibacterium komossense]MCV7230507.1 tRNA lysidine(34) synthetase TilS [Mycolicibacterium komossense]
MDRPRALTQPVPRITAAVSAFATTFLPDTERWCVALSGGPDSLALTAAAALVLPTTALIVDHGLQAGSAQVAETARRQALELGCVEAKVLAVQVGTAGGPESAARTARYAALDDARAGAPVLIGHTLDDQAETVLLGLGRGSGPRSISGIRPHDPPWCRPLLQIRRAETEGACAELGVIAWRDPHNADPRFTRVRLRNEVLPLLEDVLGGGVAEALARTAAALQDDADVLDALADAALVQARTGDCLEIAVLTPLSAAVRRRVIRAWLLSGGAAALTDKQIRAVELLVTGWRGQGGVAVAAGLVRQRLFAERKRGVLALRRELV